MTYIGLPPYYPSGWFWLGGRLADLTGTPAWEMFKPWSIVSITAAIAVALVLWAAMIRFELALVVSTATAAATLAYAPAEPYAAIITVLLPPVFVLAWSGLRADRDRGNGWAAVVGVGLFLGLAALFYTLLLGYAAFTVTIMALLAAVTRRSWGPVFRLAVIAVIQQASSHWSTGGRTSWPRPRAMPADTGTALHYLPADGAQLTFPMLDEVEHRERQLGAVGGQVERRGPVSSSTLGRGPCGPQRTSAMAPEMAATPRAGTGDPSCARWQPPAEP